MANVAEPPNAEPSAGRATVDGEATAAEVEAAAQAARMDAAAAALTPELRAAVDRANAVRNTIAIYRGTLLREDAPAAIKAEARARIDAAWRALQGHGVEEWNRVLLMRAVDFAARAGRGAEAVLAELPPELVACLDPHREALGALVAVWPRTTAGKGARGTLGKFAACAALWEAATGTKTTDKAWKTLWFDVAADQP
jgi:hypothetical protein